jgi:uncharacterized membrane protein
VKNRVLANLLTSRRALRRAFPTEVLDTIETAIKRSEQRHSGEIRFAVETTIDLPDLLRGTTARERSIEAFAQLHTWDTAANNGVLIYVLLSEHDIEIVADRGFNDRVSRAEWEAVCREMESAYRHGDFEAGSLRGVERVTELIARHFPPGKDDSNELADRPVLL